MNYFELFEIPVQLNIFSVKRIIGSRREIPVVPASRRK
jgi:hypothetical protein